MKHGLGDFMQFSIVLKHLKHYIPEMQFAVETLPGREAILRGLATYKQLCSPFDVWNWEESLYINFPMADREYQNLPQTKTTHCIVDDLGLEPKAELYSYNCILDPEIKNAVFKQRDELGKKVILLHGKGVSKTWAKNLDDKILTRIEEFINASDKYICVNLDKTPASTVDHLGAMIESASLCIFVDSGPLHVAGAFSTPTWGIWLKHHPVRCIEPFDHMTHWMPTDAPEVGIEATRVFGNQYRSLTYETLSIGLLSALEAFMAEDRLPYVKRAVWVAPKLSGKELEIWERKQAAVARIEEGFKKKRAISFLGLMALPGQG